ncbi:hypothetical protein K7432_014537 [Basidiobolus ranarum]|uniref:Enoyl reductase (ER) domain-containing protein n=1 Tax=Basidiobolus ranarum TaxID=34480 RepID=A0ABR2VPI2_9FUNG
MATNTLKNTRVIRTSYVNESEISVDNFRVETVDIKVALNEGEFLLKNLYMSLDIYIRHFFNKDYRVPEELKQLNIPIIGLGVSEVIETKNSTYPVGTIVSGNTGWETYSIGKEKNDFRVLENARQSVVPLSHYVGALGMPGLTAYAGLKSIGEIKAGETIFIASAAGGVGQLVGQLAKHQGLRVIGSAGSDEKVDYLTKHQKFDAAFNYKTHNTQTELSKLAPNGIDVYYDLVGGETLDIVLDQMNDNGRIVSVGMLSQENGEKPYPLKHLHLIAPKNIRLQGFIYWYHTQYWNDLDTKVAPMLKSGEIIYRENVIDGLENAPQTFVDLLNGKYPGKVVIKIAEASQ